MQPQQILNIFSYIYYEAKKERKKKLLILIICIPCKELKVCDDIIYNIVKIDIEIEMRLKCIDCCSTYNVLEAKFVSSCFNWPSRASPHLSLLLANNGMRVNTLDRVKPGPMGHPSL
jgi:hypothetical protein